MRLPCTNSKVSAEQFRLSCCCKALHATNKLISAVLQVPMLIVFWRCLGKNVVIMSKASPQVSQNSMQMEATKRTFPTWRKSTTNWTLSGNLWPTLGQSATDFGDITDFEEIRHRLWGNPSPTLVKSATDFVKLRFQDKKSFWEKPGVSKKEANRWGVGRVNGSNLLTLMSKLFWGLC